ncbi:LysR family transcriptional regulator [Pseudonocardia kujensis]|uniref:LysR family transcriptional regulator n=1 Tax=Pseudonocardia kujensis TaxID=1128675 RepID=UPI001E531BD6|nr:LysR family transcriptional regulator [Pseudonocardia kujensis]MCE0763044.1 LysR family transcriptional regulator [Pseudonocardia kujensis]
MTAPNRTLDVVALRSFVAVCDHGGFHRAAEVLHVSQPTVSHHVRRLEAACGQPLFRKVGRASRLTAAGEMLLPEARRMLALHDQVLARLSAPAPASLTLGSTEHAADLLLPRLTGVLGGSVRYRLDRGVNLRAALDRGDLDLALVMGEAVDDRSADAGELDLHWFAAPGWRPPGGALPLVALDEPCAVRDRALTTLAAAARPVTVACEAAYLAGVLAAARAGLGIALLATMGSTPEGLVRRDDLPPVPALPMSVRCRAGMPAETLAGVAAAAGAALID